MDHIAAGGRGATRVRPARPVLRALAMLAALALLLASLWTAAPVGAGIAAQTNPILELLRAAAELSGDELVIDGDIVTLVDRENDQQGFQDPAGDILNGWIYDVPMVPGYLLEAASPFGCDTVVLCSPRGAAEPQAFDGGAWLIVVQLGGPISALDPARRWEAGAFFQLAEYPTTQVGPGNLIGGYSHLVVARQQGTTRGVFEYGVGTGAFEEFQTRTRVRTEKEYVGLLVARETDLPRMATGWGLYAFSSDATQAGTGRDVLGAIGDPPTPIGTPPAVRFQEAVTTAPPVTVPSPTAASVATGTPPPGVTPVPGPTQGPPTTPTGSGLDLPWLALIGLGGLLALAGLFLLRGRGERPVPAGAGPASPTPSPGAESGGAGLAAGAGGAAIASSPGDPCPPLIEAARQARAACDEATRAAAAAADSARERAAEADEAAAELEKARRAREAAEAELARRQEEPDRSSSMSSGDRYEDSYDLKLKADARAAANAAHAAARDAATTDEARREAGEAWQQQLEHIDSQEGLDELRRNDAEGRAKWVEEAQGELDAARDAEANAQASADRASEAAAQATAQADAAKGRADDACARADAAERAAIDAGCMGPKGGAAAPPPVPPPPTPPPASPPPPAPPTTLGGGTPPPTGGTPPPTPPTRERPRCPDGAEPRVTERNAIEVDLYLISESRLKIDSNYPYGDDIDEALDDLDARLGAVGAIMNLPGAFTDPVPTILSTDPPFGLGLPSFDSSITKPAEAAAKALRRLREKFEKFRRTGTWSLSVPLQHYRFSCRITEECIDGAWVVTKREFTAERIGKPRYDESAPYEVQDVAYDGERAWRAMTAKYIRANAEAERRIGEAAKACGA